MVMLARQLPPQIVRAQAAQLRAAPYVAPHDEAPRSRNAFLDALLNFSKPGLLELFFGLAPVEAQDATFAVGAQSQEFSQARKRNYLLIANMGANDIRVSFGKPVSTTTGLVISGQGFYEPLRPLASSINALSTVGSTLLIIEG